MTSSLANEPGPRPISSNVPRIGAPFGLKGKRAAMVSFSPYPADPRPRRATEALLKEGMTIDFLCLNDDKSPKRELAEGLSIRRLAIEHRRGGVLSYAYQYFAFILITSCILAWRCLKHRYDLVYINNMPDILVISSLVPKLMGAKVILDQHDPMPELMTTIFNLDKRSFGVRVIELMERWSIARAHLVITVNIACKRLFSTRSCRPEKIGVVMNAPDDSIFPFETPTSGLPRSNRLNKPFVIMYHGSIVERNGLDLAVEALARVREAVPAADLRIYGRRTPFLDEVLADVRKRGLDCCVHYCGPRRLEELVREIKDCDIGVVPNHRSDFAEINTPTRIFEYLALGKPVIVPRTRGIQDYFSQDALLFFEPGNADDLAQQIHFAWANSSELAKTTERGQAVFLQHRWQQEKETLVNLVGELLNG